MEVSFWLEDSVAYVAWQKKGLIRAEESFNSLPALQDYTGLECNLGSLFCVNKTAL